MKRPLLTLVFLGLAFAACDSGGDPPANQAPSASFSFVPTEPRAGEGVRFTADASDPDGQIATYSWDFDGDGVQDATGERPAFEFGLFGTYDATLTVTDNEGATRSVTRQVPVLPRYNQATVTAVTVTDMPFTDAAGTGGTGDSAPDVYLSFYLGDNEYISSSRLIFDLTPERIPIQFPGSDFLIGDLSTIYEVVLSVLDPPAGGDGRIGAVDVDLSDLVGTYPSSLTLSNGEGVTFVLALQWGLAGARTEARSGPDVAGRLRAEAEPASGVE